MVSHDPPPVTLHPFEYTINSSTLRVEYRDITLISADVLVSSNDTNLLMGSGVSLALLRRGGPEIMREAQDLAPLPLGEIAVTSAGRLNAKKIFHCAVLDYDHQHLTTLDLIRTVTRRCLVTCDAKGFTSIAFPAFATGVAALSPERAAAAMLISIAAYLSGSTQISSVTIALFSHFSSSHEVLLRFYARVADFVDLARHLQSTTIALARLEQAYRELGADEAAAQQWVRGSDQGPRLSGAARPGGLSSRAAWSRPQSRRELVPIRPERWRPSDRCRMRRDVRRSDTRIQAPCSCAAFRHASAQLRQAPAHAPICGSLPTRSHAVAQASQITAHRPLSCGWNTDVRAMKFAAVAQISAQSCKSRT